MAKTREQKKDIVKALADKLARMKSAVFTSISGYTMKDANALREKGSAQDVALGVTKKTLLARALKEAKVDVDVSPFEGSVLTSIGFADEVAPAKLIAEFAKGRDAIKILGGILEGKLVDAETVKALAKIPGKQELLAKMVGSLNAPVSGFVNVLAGNLRSFVQVLGQIQKAKT